MAAVDAARNLRENSRNTATGQSHTFITTIAPAAVPARIGCRSRATHTTEMPATSNRVMFPRTRQESTGGDANATAYARGSRQPTSQSAPPKHAIDAVSQRPTAAHSGRSANGLRIAVAV